jgi:putative N-acetyltransferase (TIGR04045 family)
MLRLSSTPTPAPAPTVIEQTPIAARAFETRIARGTRERDAYFALRREIFCAEQGLFTGDDRDACDEQAIPIICLTTIPGAAPRVVGVVRVWEEAPGDWWGGRLGVDPAFRTVGGVGRWLVQTAVGSARAWGAWRFRATVQQANVVFFRRLRWHTREQTEILGHPHHLMEADLTHYAPTGEVRPREVTDDAA